MTERRPATMQAALLTQFGGIEALTVQAVPVPAVGPEDVLIRVRAAGVGSWDAEEREGHYAAYLGPAHFPYILGWEGAGTVAAVGNQVQRFSVGDQVYATVVPTPHGGGFYAEYAAAPANDVAPLPAGVTMEQAAALGWDALTALTGLDDVLHLQPGDMLMIIGASGGIGHLAVQLAQRMGARVFAVASGDDGVALAQRLGAEAAINGRAEDVLAAATAFAPQGIAAALVTAGGPLVQRALGAVRDGGRIAVPNGVTPMPAGRSGVHLSTYDAIRGPDATARLHRLIGAAPFAVHVSQTFALERAADAHRTLAQHYLGKLALVVR